MISQDKQGIIRGRCVAIEPSQIAVRDASGTHRLELAKPSTAAPGDVVEVSNGVASVLTPNRRPKRDWPVTTHVLDPRRLHGAGTRAKVESAIREFFIERDFLETRTPLVVPSPGMEPHIRSFEVSRPASGGEVAGYLPTSPEFAMKRLLAGGLERVFQICPAFRDEPLSTTHQTEFTMLEWYRAYAGYEQIMRDTEELFAFVARKTLGKSSITYEGREIDVTTPWPRLRVRDLFSEQAGIDLVASGIAEMRSHCARLGLGWAADDTWDDLYFRVWLNVIEPRLPADRAVFVTRYPASQAALAVVDSDEDGSRWAKRFELYAGGLELGNAFEELTDPVEQRRRFVKDMELRERAYGTSFPRSPLDEGFLAALEEGMPPAGGIAVGVDRMVMLMAGEAEIAYTLWLPGGSGV